MVILMLTSYILDLKDLLNMYSCEEQRFISGSNEKKKQKTLDAFKGISYKMYLNMMNQ